MTAQLAELEKQARELSRAERAELALILIESLDITEDQAAVDESWRVEIERRGAKDERGDAKAEFLESVRHYTEVRKDLGSRFRAAVQVAVKAAALHAFVQTRCRIPAA